MRIGAVLAGGLGTRLRRGDKPLVAVGGITMIGRACACLTAQADRVIINANGDPMRFGFLGVPVIPDEITEQGGAGPLAGIHAVLSWALRETGPLAAVVTAPGDTPFLPSDLVLRLSTARMRDGADIAVAGSNGRVHPIIACWPATLADDLGRALRSGIRKIDRFTSMYEVVTVDWKASSADPFFNVNTPEDLNQAEILATRSPESEC